MRVNKALLLAATFAYSAGLLGLAGCNKSREKEPDSGKNQTKGGSKGGSKGSSGSGNGDVAEDCSECEDKLRECQANLQFYKDNVGVYSGGLSGHVVQDNSRQEILNVNRRSSNTFQQKNTNTFVDTNEYDIVPRNPKPNTKIYVLPPGNTSRVDRRDDVTSELTSSEYERIIETLIKRAGNGSSGGVAPSGGGRGSGNREGGPTVRLDRTNFAAGKGARQARDEEFYGFDGQHASKDQYYEMVAQYEQQYSVDDYDLFKSEEKNLVCIAEIKCKRPSKPAMRPDPKKNPLPEHSNYAYYVVVPSVEDARKGKRFIDSAQHTMCQVPQTMTQMNWMNPVHVFKRIFGKKKEVPLATLNSVAGRFSFFCHNGHGNFENPTIVDPKSKTFGLGYLDPLQMLTSDEYKMKTLCELNAERVNDWECKNTDYILRDRVNWQTQLKEEVEERRRKTK